MSVGALCRRITQLGFDLLQWDLALDAKAHAIRDISESRAVLEWARQQAGYLISKMPPRVADYRQVLEAGEYSYLMKDGGVLQISYVFDRGEIAGHRLNYFPCPVEIDETDLAAFGGAVLDYLDYALTDDLETRLVFRSPIRFDFDPMSAEPSHPASHVTVNETCCRIPARAPLSFDTFIKLIFENFYPSIWSDKRVREALTLRQETECLSEDDKGRAYLHWHYPSNINPRT